MAKIVFCFAGTSDPGDAYAAALEESNDFHNDVIRVYLRGCQDSNVGGTAGEFFPNLDIVAEKISSAFNPADQTIDMDKLKSKLGGAICLIKALSEDSKPIITDIGLQGFSRGAVTCFAVGKKLDSLGIPIDIIANQPVPGDLDQKNSRSIYRKYHDLTACKNIRSATTFVGSYNLENGIISNLFYKQMLAKFPKGITTVNTWLMPYQGHLDWFKHKVLPLHINKQFTAQGYADNPSKTDSQESLLRTEYNKKENALYFTPKTFAQPIFGAEELTISKDPVYLKMILVKANTILTCCGNTDLDQRELSQEQASAIVVIGSLLDNLTEDEQLAMYTLILENSLKGEQFTAIINKIDETVNYLTQTVKDDNSDKSTQIQTHAPQFKKEVFLSTYDYLVKEIPTKGYVECIGDAEKKIALSEYINNIQGAEHEFEHKALDINRGLFGKVLTAISRAVLDLVSLFFKLDSLDEKKINGLSFFHQTRSTHVMRKALAEIKNLSIESNGEDNAEDESEKQTKHI